MRFVALAQKSQHESLEFLACSADLFPFGVNLELLSRNITQGNAIILRGIFYAFVGGPKDL